MKTNTLILTALFTVLSVISITDCSHDPGDHSTHSMEKPLDEAGQDAFGTIQEVILKLENEKDVDWSQVDLEALRQHLVDMNEMTLNIGVKDKENIAGGFKATIIPQTEQTYRSLEEVLLAHPPMLKAESGWDMAVKVLDDAFEIEVTTAVDEEVEKVRAFGYIGVMAYGNHHQYHHWGIATGDNPHTR